MEETQMNVNWEYKYRPSKLSEFVLSDTTRKQITQMITDGKLKNIILSGVPGIGKTTLARVIANEVGAVVKFIDGSVKNSLDTVRIDIQGFCDRNAGGKLKVVIIDEAEDLTRNAGTGSSAQAALKNVIDGSSSDTRFIFTCNDKTKLIDAIQSRCTEINITFENMDIVKRCVHILREEGITFTKEVLKEFVSGVVVETFPDIRSIISTLETWCVDGNLVKQEYVSFSELDEMVDYILDNIDTPTKVRQYLMDNENQFGKDYIKLAGAVFNAISSHDIQLTISEYIYRMHQVADIEIQFYAMILGMKKIANKN